MKRRNEMPVTCAPIGCEISDCYICALFKVWGHHAVSSFMIAPSSSQ